MQPRNVGSSQHGKTTNFDRSQLLVENFHHRERPAKTLDDQGLSLVKGHRSRQASKRKERSL